MEPWPSGTNAEDYLELTLRAALQRKTEAPDVKRQLEKYGRFVWVLDGESVPQVPYAQISKARPYREKGQGVPLIRKRPEGNYREEYWRLQIELFTETPSDHQRTLGSPPSVSSIISKIVDDLFMMPPGRSALRDIGIYSCRVTKEGDTKEGDKYSLECMTATAIGESQSDPDEGQGAEE